MTTVLVTSGNIGNSVAEGLGEKGAHVRVLARSPKSSRRWMELGIEQVSGDWANPKSLSAAFDGVDQFFSVTPFLESLAQLGINAIEAAKKAGVRYIVRSSALGASDQGTMMGRWHREVEKALEESGIPCTILQPNTFMQSYFMQAESIRSTGAFYMPQGGGKVSLIDVRDIAAVAVACLTEPGHEGETYVLTGGESLSNFEIAAKVSDTLGRKISYYDVPPEQAADSMRNAGVPEWMVQSLLELFAFCKAGSAAGISPAVEAILKRKPITFDRFLAENKPAFQSNRDVAGVA